MQSGETPKTSNFIYQIIDEDLRSGKNGGRVMTRFPPEPNGYLHIGHAKSICLNFGIAADYPGAVCHLRFDDTNPAKEEVEYIESIKRDIQWLGFDWGENLFFASDYFEQLYSYAVELIKLGKAYVCDLSGEEIRAQRGTLKEPGKESPWRGRSVDENLRLFEAMRAGEFADGEKVLRARIDMASPNLNMRDPVLYRIRRVHHHRTGDKWCIYPMYDFTHCLSDAIEKITHSVCTLEFEDHRPLYDWVLETLQTPAHPQQIEFARLNLTYTVMSKRMLLQLVTEQHVNGWDDPRMPTVSGMRRRGYTPEAIREFARRIGVAKTNSTVDIALLEHCLREDLNQHTDRVMTVLDPLKVVITDYPAEQTEQFNGINNPEQPEAGSHTIPFGRELWIERSDFMEEPPRKYFRLSPGKEVRLKHAYYITCNEVIRDPQSGEITELHCSYDPESRGGTTPDKRKVKGTLNWVSAAHAVPVEVRNYDRLFGTENPGKAPEGGTFLDNLNPDSLEINRRALAEPFIREFSAGDRVQFLRHGYYCADPDSTAEHPVWNRTVSLRDSWAKKNKQ